MQNEKKNSHVQLLDLLLGWNFLEMMQSILMKMKERKCDMRCKKKISCFRFQNWY